MNDTRWPLLVGIALVVLGALGATAVVSRVASPDESLDPAPAPPAASQADVAAVDAFMATALEGIGAREPLVRAEEGGVLRAIYRLDRGTDPLVAAERMRDGAGDLEVYTTRVDGLDAEVRAYAGALLRHQVLLMPDLPPNPVADPSAHRRTWPLLALIIRLNGDEDAPTVVRSPVPLTLAIRAHRPHSLRLAQRGAEHWHEVLVELDPGPSEAALHEALSAVPHVSGVLVESDRDLPPLPLARPVVLTTRPGGARSTAVRAQRPTRISARDALTRAAHRARQEGAAALVLDGDNPGLSDVLAWAEGAATAGFRMALASEIARLEQVQGPPPLSGD